MSGAEGQVLCCAKGERHGNPAQSENLCMRGHSLSGNRETLRTPAALVAGRSGKATNLKPDMHVHRESDGGIVPEKPPNKGGTEHSPAEAGEGRPPTEGNALPPPADRTQRRTTAKRGLQGVREAARREGRMRFTALLHHVTVDLLRESYRALHRQAAPGVDGQTWAQYADGLEAKLRDLHERVHRGTYRAQPSKRTYIPKADGKLRPLGIAALEDKIVQRAVVTVLNCVYEEDFLGFSYGFRPGRHQHQALDALWVGLTEKRVNWVLDADIRGFFDAINHDWLLKFIEHRIADRRILRLIRKWLRAGVTEGGAWAETKVGTPQGAVVSPFLANVYLHYVLDQWVQQWRGRNAAGAVIIVRYADDFVMGFQHRAEAERFLTELRERLEKFGLSLHSEKTRLLEFGRYAVERHKRRGEGKPETFNFLGFTHYCGQRRKDGSFTVKRETMAQRQSAKLKAVGAELLYRRHEPVAQLGAWLGGVVRGYLNYHAVPGNIHRLGEFLTQVTRAWLRALKRRSQKSRLTWSRFKTLAKRWLPKARILHPYPSVRFHATHPM